jgi:parallel beta-helix repeat protein
MKNQLLNKLISVFLVFLVLSTVCLTFNFTFSLVSAAVENFAITASGDDGHVYGRNADYLTARSTAFASENTTASVTIGQKYQLFPAYYFVYRTFLKFDTSVIPLDANISSASLKIYGYQDYSSTDFDIRIQGWTGDTPINTGDYNQYDSSNNGNISTSSFVTGGWNTIPITNYGILKRESWTKICLRSNRDVDSTVPTGNEYITIYTYDQGASYAPYLEINYTAPLPKYSSVGHNTSLAGASCEFYTNWSSSLGLSGYIFGWNISGIFTNDTWTDPWSGSPKTGWSNVTRMLSIEGGNRIEWCFWANDTHNEWNTTGLMTFVVSGYPAYYNATSSDSITSKACTFNATWTPRDGSLSHYVLETNNTGQLVNYTYSFEGRTFSNVTLILNSTRYVTVQWRIFANNTDNRWNCTPTSYIVVYPPTPPMQRGVLGYSDTSGENGIYYKGAKEAIYCAWLNSSSVKFQVAAYDIGSQQWTPTVDVSAAPSPEGHWQPSVGVLPNGSLVIFYGHLTSVKYKFTTQSAKMQANLTALISEWSTEYFIPDTENKHCSYPYPICFDDVLVLYYRYDDFYHWRVINFTDSWQTARMLMSSSKEIYMWFTKINETMIIGSGRIQDNGYRDVLLFYSNDKGVTYSQINGTGLTLPFDSTNVVAVDTGSDRVTLFPCLDKEGRVVISYVPTEFLVTRYFCTIAYYNISIGNPGGTFIQANATDENDQVIEASMWLFYDTYYEQPATWCSPLNKFNVSIKEEYNLGNPTKYVRMPNNLTKFLKVYENTTLSAKVDGRQIQNMPRAFEVFGRIEQGYMLGYQKKGSSNYSDITVDRIFGCRYVANSSSKVNSVVVRIWWGGDINSLYGKAALYDSSLNLVSGGAETNIVGGYDKVWDYWTAKIPLSGYVQLEAGKEYWICIKLNGGAYLYYDPGSNNQSFVVFTRYASSWNQTLSITDFGNKTFSFFALSIDLECYGLKLKVHNLNTDLRYVTIQEAINAPETLDGHTIFVEGGVFLESVVVNKSLTIMADSMMNVLVDGLSGIVCDVTANNSKIENLIMTDGDKGIRICRVNNATIRNNIITGNSAGIYAHEVVNCTLSGNNITSNSQYGMNLTKIGEVTIENNVVTGSSEGIYLCNASISTLSRNTIASNIEHNLVINEVNDINVKNNIVSDGSGGIYLSEASDCELDGNNVTSNTQYGLNVVYQINNVTIENNTITSNADGIYLYNASSCTLSGNSIASSSQYGLDINCSSNLILRNNHVNSSKYNFGVVGNDLSHYVHDIDQSNEVNGKEIVYLINLTGGVVDGAIFPNLGYLGIVNSSNVHIRNVELRDNIQGMLFAATNYSFAVKSNITNNLYGFHLWSSYNNTVFYNNFINNSQQAYAPVSVNVWDNGYPSGGNYWSDYAGMDQYSGPYQNETNSDGIGDTPYVIDAENMDDYPLMSPYPCVHAIAVANITPYEVLVKRGNVTQVNVTIIDQGHFAETFNLSLYANATLIDTIMNALVTSSGSVTLTFAWNTTVSDLGDYIISAYAYPVIGEAYIADNSFVDGWIHVGFHDMAVLNITTSHVLIGRGFNITVNITVENQGDYDETFDLIIYANTTIIATFNVTLSAESFTIMTFAWNTSDFAYGNYTINGEIVPVANETETQDNAFNTGIIKVSIPGDANGDFKVGPADFALLAAAYGTIPGMPKWDMYADFNCDDKVGPPDFAILAKYYGQSIP